MFEDGHTVVPTAPGMGVELDEEVARAHPFDGEGLHLEMVDDPVGLPRSPMGRSLKSPYRAPAGDGGAWQEERRCMGR